MVINNNFTIAFIGASKTVAKVLRNHYSQLSYATENSLQVIADKMYSKELICREVRKAPTLEKIEVEFLAIASLYKDDISMLEKKCLVFLQCLASAEGPAEKEAIALAKDWECQVFKCDQILFPVHQEMIASSSHIVINSADSIAKELSDLQKEFHSIIVGIRVFYATSTKHNVVNIARWVEECFDEITDLACNSLTIDSIFNRMKSHYNFLDIELIQDLIATYPIHDATLQSRFKNYVENRSRFIKLAKVRDLLTKIDVALKQEASEHRCKLILTLSGEWSMQSIDSLYKLIKYFFGDKAKYITFNRSYNGSIIIHFIISSSKIAETLVCMVQAKTQYMHHFGIFQLIINKQIIINRDESVTFCFEKSLLYAITNINDYFCGKEYQNMVLFFSQLAIDINYQNEEGNTAFMLASEGKHYHVVKLLLLNKDLNVNIQNNNGMTALMLASCHQPLVSEILNIKIPLMFEDFFGGHHQVVELLLSKDPDINIQNNDGWTALMSASRYGHHQVVELLLSKDPDINIQNNDGVTALMSACRYGHHQVVELLLSKDPDNIQDNDGRTALMFASRYGHHQVVELLLSKNPNINIQSNTGWTALMLASENGHHQVVELLLNKDPDINIQDNDGWTALMFASQNGHHQVVELLLSKDPDINIQDNDGWTALMFASKNGHHQVVELLLSKDPDINIQDNDGWTALMFASQNEHHQVVELLLSKDPDINIQDTDRVTALMIASYNGHHQVVELLLSKDPKINIQSNDGVTALMFASQNGHHQVVELLLSKDPGINIQNNDGWTALMLASCYGHHQVVELLLSIDTNIFNIQSRKCDISMEDIIGAFTIACYEGHSSIVISLTKKLTTLSNDERELLVATANGDIRTLVSMLFEVGMSPDTPLVGGITPLMIAASCGHIEIVNTLIQAGADVNKTNDEGETTLDILSGNIEGASSAYILDLLITNGASTAAQANPTQS